MTITISPLADTDLDRFCSLSGLGELTPDEVRAHKPEALISVQESGLLTGRASLWWGRVPVYADERIGLIGHYGAENARAAGQVLSTACAELARRGCTLAVGPMDGSTWRRYRLLTERGSNPVFFLEPDNPDDWPLHFDAQGFAPLARYYSALNEDISSPFSLSQSAARDFSIRSLEFDQIGQELHRLWIMASGAFTGNYLYLPIDEAEFHAMYRKLLPLLRPELVLIAERDGALAGFSFAIPDILQARRGVVVDTVIVKTVAVMPEWRGQGLGSLLIERVNQAAAGLGLRRAIHAMMHEENPSRKIGRGLLHDFRCYTLFARPL